MIREAFYEVCRNYQCRVEVRELIFLDESAKQTRNSVSPKLGRPSLVCGNVQRAITERTG